MSKFNFTENEKTLIEHWKTTELYEEIRKKHTNSKIFDFIDGPMFASGSPHVGHIHVWFLKSIIYNYYQMSGFSVCNTIGGDFHGVPSEQLVSKLLGLQTNQDIIDFGVDNYTDKCKKTVESIFTSWNDPMDRIGRFIDFSDNYKTMDKNFMESVWWAFSELWKKGLVYRASQIMPYSTGCGTPLSNFEASDDVYRDVTDPAIYVKFKVTDNTYFVAFTTTPWTLPSNLALAVGPTITYVKVQDYKTQDMYYVAEATLTNLYGKHDKTKNCPYTIMSHHLGQELVGMTYESMFDYFKDNDIPNSFTVIGAEFVCTTTGSGIVHIAPGFGVDDFDICVKNHVVTNKTVIDYCPVDDHGCFTSKIYDYKGKHVLAVNMEIIDRLKKEGRLVKKEMYRHKYPYCWRTDQPLIFKAVSCYFIDVPKIQKELLKNNGKVNWQPDTIGNRMHDWLINVRPWCVSRSRFFGTSLPVWISDDGEESICVGSIDELAKLANIDPNDIDLHKDCIDKVTIISAKGTKLHSVGLVMDCWFESGAVPFARHHYPFENKDFIDKKDYLSECIIESSDQVRGWFYTLQVLSTALFDKPAYKNVLCSGLILADDGKKYSKRHSNYVDPQKIIDEYSSDAGRLYLMGSPASHGNSFKFKLEDIEKYRNKLFQLYNCLLFLQEHTNKFYLDTNYYPKEDLPTENVMDHWIIARLNSVITNIKINMNEYKVYKIVPLILDFIEDLTNWYVKFNRNRLRGRYHTKDEQEIALSTLKKIMIIFAQVMAPFAPFISETIYGKLSKGSVHLCNFPEISTLDTKNIQYQMEILQTVSKIVRNIRAKYPTITLHKIPLKNILISTNCTETINGLKLLETYLKTEINTMNVQYSTDNNMTKYVIQPNSKEIGQKFGKSSSLIKSKLMELSQDDIEKFMSGVSLNIGEFVLDSTCVSVNKILVPSDIPNQVRLMENNLIVTVDITQDDEVMDYYSMRLFVTNVQKLRKNSSLKPWNKIEIYYQTDNISITNAVAKYKNKIVEELLYEIYDLQMMPNNAEIIIGDTVTIRDTPMKIVITKPN